MIQPPSPTKGRLTLSPGGNDPQFSGSGVGLSTGRRTIVLVEPENLVRHGLKVAINSLADFQVIGTAGDLQQAMELIGKLSPDILLSEVALPGASGIELFHELQRQKIASVKPIILSQIDSPEIVREAFIAGAQGYILKNCELSELSEALKTVVAGQRYLPPKISDSIDFPEDGETPSMDLLNRDPLHLLSARERQVFHLLAEGMQNNVIAKNLFISPRTVETHRARIVRKIGVSSNGDLIRFAIRHRLSTL